MRRATQDRGYDERLHILSLGQGQGPKAEKLLTLGRETGDWVLKLFMISSSR